MTRRQKQLVRVYALNRERLAGSDVTKVRFLPTGDVRAYCSDGYTYLVDPPDVLLAEAEAAYMADQPR